jgi:hypothetical protein
MLFLDTDILSYLLANNEVVINRVAAWQDGQGFAETRFGRNPAITAITVYEVLKGFRHKLKKLGFKRNSMNEKNREI